MKPLKEFVCDWTDQFDWSVQRKIGYALAVILFCLGWGVFFWQLWNYLIG